MTATDFLLLVIWTSSTPLIPNFHVPLSRQCSTEPANQLSCLVTWLQNSWAVTVCCLCRIMVAIMTGIGIIWIPVVQNVQGGQLFIYIQAVSAYFSPPIAALYLISILWTGGTEKVCNNTLISALLWFAQLSNKSILISVLMILAVMLCYQSSSERKAWKMFLKLFFRYSSSSIA